MTQISFDFAFGTIFSGISTVHFTIIVAHAMSASSVSADAGPTSGSQGNIHFKGVGR